MKILVLGDTGFIGENLMNRLKKDGCNVVGCSRKTGVDILNYNEIRDFIKIQEPDVIYNLASHGGSMLYVREFAADVVSDNIQMCLNLYKAVLEVNPNIKIIQLFISRRQFSSSRRKLA